MLILFEESDVLKFELYSLFCLVARTLHRIFTNPQEIVEHNEDQVANGPVKFCGRGASSPFYKEFRDVSLDGELFCCWWVLLSPFIVCLL
jgi:hypothetical protein